MRMPNSGGSDGKNERLNDGPQSGQIVRHQRERGTKVIQKKTAEMRSCSACRHPVEKGASMLPENIPLPSINDPAELRQRTEFCRDKLSMEEYAE